MVHAYRVACGTYERTVFAVDVSIDEDESVSVTPLFVNPAHVGSVKSLAMGGDFLASGSTDEVIKLFNLSARVELGALHHHQGSVVTLEFHNGTHLLSGSEDGLLVIWRTSDWELLKVMRGHEGAINGAAIHPSGHMAVSVGRDRTLRLWDLVKGKQSFVKRLPAVASGVKWSPAGDKYVLLYDKALEVFAVADGERVCRIERKVRINAIAVLDDILVAGDEEGHLTVFSLPSGELLREASQASSRIRDLQVCGGYVFTCSSDGFMRVWSLETLKELGSHSSTLRLTAVSVRSNAPPAPKAKAPRDEATQEQAPKAKKQRIETGKAEQTTGKAKVEHKTEQKTTKSTSNTTATPAKAQGKKDATPAKGTPSKGTPAAKNTPAKNTPGNKATPTAAKKGGKSAK